MRLPLAALVLLSLGCARAPIPTTLHSAALPSTADAAAPPLVVLLPGFGDAGEVYAERGVVAMIQRAHPDVDVVTVDARFRYYTGLQIVERLRDDVLRPARRAGARSIWLVGTSMGGLGALLVAERHPELVDGLILIAPYFGSRRTLDRIRASGGLSTWSPPAAARQRYDEELWVFLQRRARQPEGFPIFLAYGADDGGVPSFAVLGAALPESCVVVRPGAHGWTTWVRLWSELVQRWTPRAPLHPE